MSATEAEAELLGKTPSEELFADAGRLVAEACAPIGDQRGSAEYKRHVAGVLTERVLRARRRPRVAGSRVMQLTVSVNGEEHTRDVEPRMLLVHFLRDELRLTGTHWGCDTSNCGTCVVLMDGYPVKSCTVLAATAAGARDPHRRGTWRSMACSTPCSRGSARCTACSAAFARRA